MSDMSIMDRFHRRVRNALSADPDFAEIKDIEVGMATLSLPRLFDLFADAVEDEIEARAEAIAEEKLTKALY